MRVVTVANRQNLLDIAIQEYGSVEALFLILDDDKTVNQQVEITDEGGATYMEGLGIMSNLTGGQKISIKSAPVDLATYNFYQKQGFKPITDLEFTLPDGFTSIHDHNPFHYNPEDYA